MQDNDIRQVEPMIEAALVKMNNHDISAALEDLLQAVEIEPENVKILNLIAFCYFIKGNFDQAKACWEMVLRLDETNKDACMRLNKLNSPSFQFWLKRYRDTLALMESRSFAKAIAGLQQLLAENDGFVCLYELLGLCYLALSEVEKAHKAWQKGLEIDKSNQSLLGYLETGKFHHPLASEQNICSKKEIADTNSTKHGFRYHGLAWASAGVLVLGLLIPISHNISQGHGINLNTPGMQKKIMSMRQEIKDDDENVKETMVPTVDLDFSANAIKGINQSQSNKGVLSNNKANKAMEDEELIYEKGLAAYRQGDYKQAVFHWEKVVALNSGSYLNREALYYLARSQYLLGDLKQAQKLYTKYIREFPNSNYHDDSLYFLGVVYYRSGDDESARKVLAELKELAPNSGYLTSAFYQKIMQE